MVFLGTRGGVTGDFSLDSMFLGRREGVMEKIPRVNPVNFSSGGRGRNVEIKRSRP